MNKKIYISPVLELFFEDPEATLHIREIARQTKVHTNTVSKTMNLLVKEGLFIKKITKAVIEVTPNRESLLFMRLKKLFNLRKIYLSGIVDELNKEYGVPEAIILFGSYSRGEDTKRSDVDITVITKRTLNADWSKYRSIFKREIQIHEID